MYNGSKLILTLEEIEGLACLAVRLAKETEADVEKYSDRAYALEKENKELKNEIEQLKREIERLMQKQGAL